ncbi:hypothetical protein D9758_006164 [Tetrapyrgos nigripes]|uniref:Uncharacterized protein n=1 Tax=Tetrapyrgos nigripes TaxID=182062 RepID=A0A8H5GAQ7_9AGAR|nr:hypothetical protein D9758_006164 [Tetrapyrgos nigripes]
MSTTCASFRLPKYATLPKSSSCRMEDAAFQITSLASLSADERINSDSETAIGLKHLPMYRSVNGAS